MRSIRDNGSKEVEGHCNRCGKCCEESYRFHRISVQQEVVSGETIAKFGKIEVRNENTFPCPHLIFDLKSHDAVCLKQNEKVTAKDTWLEFCRDFPLFKEELIYPGCGYFERKKQLAG